MPLNSLYSQISSSFVEEFEAEIALQLSSVRGASAMDHWIKHAKNYFLFKDITSDLDPTIVDSTRSGGVHHFIRKYLSEVSQLNPQQIAALEIEKDFLFSPVIEEKKLKSASLVVMSTLYNRPNELWMKALAGSPLSSLDPPLPDLIPAPHPVHWLSTERLWPYLPEFWKQQRVCLVMLPKSTFNVRREIPPSAIESIVASIRAAGMLAVACVYPDYHGLLLYNETLRIHQYFDDIIIAGPVASLLQMLIFLTYIDACAEVWVPEADHDLNGPLSSATIFSIYRGKYASIRKEKIEVFTGRSKKAMKMLRRYPSASVVACIREIVDELMAAQSVNLQCEILSKYNILDIRP